MESKSIREILSSYMPNNREAKICSILMVIISIAAFIGAIQSAFNENWTAFFAILYISLFSSYCSQSIYMRAAEKTIKHVEDEYVDMKERIENLMSENKRLKERLKTE